MTALRKIKHSLTLAVGAVLLAIGLTQLAVFGLAAVAIPAALGVLAIELARARRWLRNRAGFLPRRNNLLSKETI